MVMAQETFCHYFLLLTLPKGASNIILKTNTEMEHYTIFVPKIMKRYAFEN